MLCTLTGVPQELKSADFDIDSAIGGDEPESLCVDCLLLIAIIAHISRHPKLCERRDPRTLFSVSLAGCFN